MKLCLAKMDVRYTQIERPDDAKHRLSFLVTCLSFSSFFFFVEMNCHCRFCHIPGRCHYGQQHGSCKRKLVLGSSNLSNKSEGHTMGQYIWKPWWCPIWVAVRLVFRLWNSSTFLPCSEFVIFRSAWILTMVNVNQWKPVIARKWLVYHACIASGSWSSAGINLLSHRCPIVTWNKTCQTKICFVNTEYLELLSFSYEWHFPFK